VVLGSTLTMRERQVEWAIVMIGAQKQQSQQ
jgi:hypothetical protein